MLEAGLPYRELHMIEVKEVLRLWLTGHGLRDVSRQTAVDRKTVRRYVEAGKAAGLVQGEGRQVDDEVLARVVLAVQPGGTSEVGDRREAYRRHSKLLETWVEDGVKGPKLVKLLARHTTEAKVPLRTMQRYVAEELAEVDRGTVRVVDGKPGELEVDFLTLGDFEDAETGQTRTMHALLCTAMYSRHQFVWPCLRETQEDLFEGLEAAWAFFGGVFPVVVSDNPKAVVDKPDPVSPTLNLGFVEYMQARDFELDACRVRTPTDKARVERQVQYARNDFFLGERFRSVAEARIEAERWCREDAGTRVHGRTRRGPVELFEAEERAVLRPAPEVPYDPPKWTNHKVNRSHAVVVGYALYSVPYQLALGAVQVRSDRSTVKFYRDRLLVKTHTRKPPGGTSIEAADLPAEKAALATRDGSSLVATAVSHGEHVGVYAERLMAGPQPWSRFRHVYRLLGLVARYGAGVVNQACGEALALDVVEVIRVDRMLQKGLVGRAAVAAVSAPGPSTGTATVGKHRFERDASEFRTGAAHASP